MPEVRTDTQGCAERPHLILLVEDDLTNQFVAKTMLEKRGFSVVCADNGLEACAYLKDHDSDLVLMDVSMPEMDGIEATIEIRREGYTSLDTPIIAMTAHNLDDVRAKCLDAGMNDYLVKPISANELVHKIEHWLSSDT